MLDFFLSVVNKFIFYFIFVTVVIVFNRWFLTCAAIFQVIKNAKINSADENATL